ncbi:translocator protein 2 isoform X1 [Mustela nigripes]|nr:translocator protein 2 isoform X1 [Mustela nigripes]
MAMETCQCHPLVIGERQARWEPHSALLLVPHPLLLCTKRISSGSRGFVLGDFASVRGMQPHGAIFLALPHLGPVLLWLLTRHQTSGWDGSPKKPPWCPPHRVLLAGWITIYFVMGYASYLVWKDLGGGFGRPLALPLGLYAVKLAVSWAALILFFGAHTHGLALLHLLLLYGLAVSTALIWHPINKLAALLLLPYLAWLTVTASIAYRLWRDSLCPDHQPQPMGEKND